MTMSVAPQMSHKRPDRCRVPAIVIKAWLNARPCWRNNTDSSRSCTPRFCAADNRSISMGTVPALSEAKRLPAAPTSFAVPTSFAAPTSFAIPTSFAVPSSFEEFSSTIRFFIELSSMTCFFVEFSSFVCLSSPWLRSIEFSSPIVF